MGTDPNRSRPADAGEPSPPSAAETAKGLAIAFLFPFTLSGLFWFSADFRRFMPPSDGTFAERAVLTLFSALGPVGWGLRLRKDGLALASAVDDVAGAFVFAALLVLAVVVAIRHCRSSMARAVGYVAILLWFGAGCAITSLRIT